MSDNSEDTCPLCFEELDATDKIFYPCTCGFQICLWCWNSINQSDNIRCPSCRQEYKQENIQKDTIPIQSKENHDKPEKRMKALEKKKELHNVRVIQRNLVYIIGIPPNISDENTLMSSDYCGQYGEIVKIVVNRSYLSSNDNKNPSCSAYITFKNKEDALSCIMALDGFWIDNRMLTASFGTTKYCNYFLRNLNCPNSECLYLHSLGDEADSFTKDDMSKNKSFFMEQTHPGRGKQPYTEQSSMIFPPPPDQNNIPSPVIKKDEVKIQENLPLPVVEEIEEDNWGFDELPMVCQKLEELSFKSNNINSNPGTNNTINSNSNSSNNVKKPLTGLPSDLDVLVMFGLKPKPETVTKIPNSFSLPVQQPLQTIPVRPNIPYHPKQPFGPTPQQQSPQPPPSMYSSSMDYPMRNVPQADYIRPNRIYSPTNYDGMMDYSMPDQMYYQQYYRGMNYQPPPTLPQPRHFTYTQMPQ